MIVLSIFCDAAYFFSSVMWFVYLSSRRMLSPIFRNTHLIVLAYYLISFLFASSSFGFRRDALVTACFQLKMWITSQLSFVCCVQYSVTLKYVSFLLVRFPCCVWWLSSAWSLFDRWCSPNRSFCVSASHKIKYEKLDCTISSDHDLTHTFCIRVEF